MKRALLIVFSIVVSWPALAAAQAPAPQLTTAPPLADVAKVEESRRKGVRKPAKVYTNGDLTSDFSTPVAPAASTPAASSGNGSTTIPLSPEPPPGTVPGDPPPGARDEKYWRDRIATARTTLDRSRIFADALQSRINGLNTDIVNRDDPAQKMKLEQDRREALAELDRVKKEMESQSKAVAEIEEEARRAGAPAAWLRPGA